MTFRTSRQTQWTVTDDRGALASTWAFAFDMMQPWTHQRVQKREAQSCHPEGSDSLLLLGGKIACSLTDQSFNVYAVTAQIRWHVFKGGILEKCLQTAKFLKLKSKLNYWIESWHSSFKNKTCSDSVLFSSWSITFWGPLCPNFLSAGNILGT